MATHPTPRVAAADAKPARRTRPELQLAEANSEINELLKKKLSLAADAVRQGKSPEHVLEILSV
jgi:hypothetical protein